MARNLSHRDGNIHSAEEAHEQFMSMLMERQAAAGMEISKGMMFVLLSDQIVTLTTYIVLKRRQC